MDAAMYFGVSKAAVESAEAATSFELVEPTEDSGIPFRTSTSKDGRTFIRWSEPVKLVKAMAKVKKIEAKEGTPPRQHTVFYAQLQVQPTSALNKGRLIHARHNVNPQTLRDGSDLDKTMNDMSIVALKSLFSAVGVTLPNGEITGDLLQSVFPPETSPTPSVLAGKRFNTVVSVSERKDGKPGKNTNVDEYTPSS